MCGILAYYNPKGISKKNIEESLLSLEKIKHRGPDGEGIVLINTKSNTFKTIQTRDTPEAVYTDTTLENINDFDFDLLLGHRRLSIFDLSTAGHQPMQGKNSSWITYNGEIYNFFEIRAELEDLGHTFKTNTDTEVILTAYQEWGHNGLSKFNGMWAFILWDGQQLFVSNDRFGVKPLYYYQNESELIFFSETKQILAFPGRVTEYNHNTIRTFLNDSYLELNNQTFFQNVLRFPNSSYSQILLSDFKNKTLETHLFYTLPSKKQKISKEQAIELFKTTLKDAIAIRLRGDVETGIAISGGLDSSAIIYTAYNTLNQKNIKTFSAVFPNEMGDESKFINIVKEDLNLNSYEVNPYQTFSFSDLKNHIYHQDTPVLTTSFYAQWCVDRLTKENGVKIFLNGQGADEVFGGYHHHFYKYCKSLILKGKLKKYLKEVKAFSTTKGLDSNKVHKIVLADIKFSISLKLKGQNSDNKLSDHWNSINNLSDVLRLDLTQTTIPNYLKSDDRNGMAFSIESRHPFMDYRLIELGLTLPDELLIRDGWQKRIIRDAMSDMPEAIRWRTDKKGFTTPQEKWTTVFKEDFESYLPYLERIDISPKSEFKYYSLAIWLSLNPLN